MCVCVCMRARACLPHACAWVLGVTPFISIPSPTPVNIPAPIPMQRSLVGGEPAPAIPILLLPDIAPSPREHMIKCVAKKIIVVIIITIIIIIESS